MFKKKNIQKSNIIGADKSQVIETGIDDGDSIEPVLKKKAKLNPDMNYSTKAQTEEYSKIVHDQTDDLLYKAQEGLLTKDNGNAFAYSEIDNEVDGKTKYYKKLQVTKDIKEGKIDSKYYSGESNYAIYAQKSEKDIHNAKYTGTLGPIRAPTNVRASCRIDYNPSLCKDWHEAGYCGFGDSCIYIHDRTDYKSGWELEKEFEREQAEKAKKLSISSRGIVNPGDDEPEEEDDGLPKACQICNEDFRSPVVTKCQHYFCDKCIFDHYKANKRCPVCECVLNGIFNQAKEIISKQKAKKGIIKKPVARIIIGQPDEKKVEKTTREGDALEGVTFELSGYKSPQEDLEKIAKEFKETVNQQKGKFQSETDWLY